MLITVIILSINSSFIQVTVFNNGFGGDSVKIVGQQTVSGVEDQVYSIYFAAVHL